jgi:general stress protein 26
MSAVEILSSAEAAMAAKEVIARAKFPMLATVDHTGLPHVRPISPLQVEGFLVKFANLRRYGKTGDIAHQPKVELCYLDDRHCQVRIAGAAELISDADEKALLWNQNPLLRKYLGSLENPELQLYTIFPKRVRFMQEWALDYYEIEPIHFHAK